MTNDSVKNTGVFCECRQVRKIRDEIKERVMKLLNEL